MPGHHRYTALGVLLQRHPSAYEQLRSPRGSDAQLLGRVLRGIGCLQSLMERDLSGHDLMALFMDGKSFGDDEMVIAIGVTLPGRKVVLGMVQTASENTKVCREFLKSLVRRGLMFEQGLLCVLDGAKGFHAAVREVFGSAALI